AQALQFLEPPPRGTRGRSGGNGASAGVVGGIRSAGGDTGNIADHRPLPPRCSAGVRGNLAERSSAVQFRVCLCPAFRRFTRPFRGPLWFGGGCFGGNSS